MEGSFYNSPTFPIAEDDNQIIDIDLESKNEVDSNREQNEFDFLLKKRVKLYTSFKNSSMWKDKIFEGIIELINDDYIIIKEDNCNFIVFNNNLNFIEFEN